MKMCGAKPDKIGVVELRRFNRHGVSCDGMAHAELEEALNERPMTLASGDIGNTRPGDADGAEEEDHPASCQQRGADDREAAQRKPPRRI